MDRQHRYCKVCSMVTAVGGQGHVKEVEDIMHSMLQCRGYASIRARYGRLFTGARSPGGKDSDMLQLLFADRNQMELA